MFDRRPGRHALLFIFFTVLIDVTGLGIIIPVIPNLIKEIVESRTPGVEMPFYEASVIGGYLTSIYALMQFVCAPMIGGLSDRFGRRPLLLFSLAGFSLDYFIMGFAPAIPLLFVGRALAGVFGASYSTAGAYIADVSAKEKRAQNFGLIGAAFGVGFIVGPVIGGYLGGFGPRAPFFAASALAFANLIYGFIVLPETLKRENRRPLDWRRANPLGSLYHMRLHPAVLGLLAAVLMFQLGHQVYPSIWSFYMQQSFTWTTRDVGISLGAVGIIGALVQGGLTRVVIPKLGAPRTLYLGLALAVISYAGFGLATHGWMIYAWIPVAGLAGLGNPALRGLMSNRIPDDSQGELQGAIASLTSLAAVISPLVMAAVFAEFSCTDPTQPLHVLGVRMQCNPDAATVPGAPFLLAAALTAVGLAAAALALSRGRQEVRGPA